MATTRINALGTATALAESDYVVVDRASGTGKATIAEVAAVIATAAGSTAKAAVRVVASYGTPAGLEVGEVVDGVTLVAGDRVLNRIGENPGDAGIFVVQASGAAVRAADFDSDEDVAKGALVVVREGDSYANSAWVLATPAPIELGVTAITFARIDMTEAARATVAAIPQHQLFAVGLPTAADDSTQGYGYGSLWVVPGMGALMCVDPTPAAAVWQVITNGDDPPDPGANIAAVGRANSDGSDADYARVDHVHDGGPVAISVKGSDFTLLPTDHVVFVEPGGGADVICAPDPAITGARQWFIKRTSASTIRGIIVQPPPGHSVEGQAADAAYFVPGSVTFGATFILTYQGGGSWWVTPISSFERGAFDNLDVANSLYVSGTLTTDGNVVCGSDVQTSGLVVAFVNPADTALATTSAPGFMSAADKDLAGPRRQSTVFHEEFRNGYSATLFGIGGSTVSGAGAANTQIPSVASHPGIVQSETGTTSTGRANAIAEFSQVYGSGEVEFEAIVRLPVLADAGEDYDFQIGPYNGSTTFDINGIYFSYRRALRGANWHLCTHNGLLTATNTGVAVAANTWTRLRFVVNAAGTSIAVYINDVLVATVTATIPTVSNRLVWLITKSAGTTSRVVQVDSIEVRETFSVAR